MEDVVEPIADDEPIEIPEPEPDEPGPLDDVGRPALSGPAFEPPDYEPTLRDAAPASTDRSLVVRRDDLRTRAQALQVTTAQTYAAAGEFAITLDGWLRDAQAHWNPRVADAHKVWKQLCDDRAAFTKPLEEAKALLARRMGDWKRADDDRAARAREVRQAELDEQAAAERARLKLQADLAAKSGDTEKAADLISESRKVQAPIATAETTAPKVAGVSHRENWTYQLTDLRDLILAVARPRILQTLIADLKTKGLESSVEGRAVLLYLDSLEQDSPDIPVSVLEENAVQLRLHAKANRDTLSWPGVRFYDAGSTAISSRGRR